MPKRVAVHTLGCKANQADADYLAAKLRHQGYEVVSHRDQAEYYIFNTCTVTDEADREARQLTRRAKRQNPDAKVIVTGCYAETQHDEIAALPSVDAVINNTEKENIADILPVLRTRSSSQAPRFSESVRANELNFQPEGAGVQGSTRRMANDNNERGIRRSRRGNSRSKIRDQEHVPSFGMTQYSKNTRAHVKIQDGCDKFCSFCIIPFARGKNRSVAPQAIVQELHKLRQHGFEEAVLTGIHIGTYGTDCGTSLEELLRLIEIEKPLPRIRLSSLDPEEISESLIETVAASQIICPHWHIAVQSGDDEILDAMRRRYRTDKFYSAIDKITSAMPQTAIGTDVIVGFPSETEAQFEKTYRMLETLPISYIHVFPYSKRRGTHAAQLDGQIDPSTKKARSKQLNKLSRQKKQQFYETFVGRQEEIIVENHRDPKEGLLKGVTPHYVPVFFEGKDTLYRQRLTLKLDRIDELRVYGSLAQ